MQFSLLQGTTCDVRDANDVKNLVSFSQENLKYIDIWVNTFETFPLYSDLIRTIFQTFALISFNHHIYTRYAESSVKIIENTVTNYSLQCHLGHAWKQNIILFYLLCTVVFRIRTMMVLRSLT